MQLNFIYISEIGSMYQLCLACSDKTVLIDLLFLAIQFDICYMVLVNYFIHFIVAVISLCLIFLHLRTINNLKT